MHGYVSQPEEEKKALCSIVQGADTAFKTYILICPYKKQGTLTFMFNYT